VPIENLAELQTLIERAGLDWRVRDVPADETHGLGRLPSDPAKTRFAFDLGQQLLARVRAQEPGVLRNRFISKADLVGHLKLRLFFFDWRSHDGVIGPVQDQGRCGSCVSFATTGLVGAQAAIELGISNLHLSEADQHFCSSHGANCGGWNNHDALDEIRKRGVLPDSEFPYMSAFDDPPQWDPAFTDPLWLAHCREQLVFFRDAYRITNFTAHNGDDRKAYIRTVGPMVCGFTVYEDFDHYAGGVYRHVTGKVRGGHAVLVVGYSDFENVWICRNSWGTTFGGASQADGTGGGFFKIGYGDSSIDDEPFYGCRGVILPGLIDIRVPMVKGEPPERIPIPDPPPLRHVRAEGSAD